MKAHKALKHVFIPHEGNDYKPHFFRETAISIMLFISIFSLGASFGSSFFIHKTVLGASMASLVLVDMANEARVAYSEQPLVRSEVLESAAELKGNDMSSQGYFAHQSPTGVTPWYWFKKVGYNFLYAGENLAINFTEARELQNAWLASPLHRANILDVRFTEIGISTVEGVFQGVPTTYVVQMFGTPVIPKAKALAVSTSSAATTTLLENKKGDLLSSTNTLSIGSVKGETTEGAIAASPATEQVSNLETILSTPELTIVRDNSNASATEIINTVRPLTYSSWYQKLVFWSTKYVDTLYKGLIILIALALLTMILVEIKKQHPRHIAYGVLMLVILSVFVFINRGFF
jgi:hypothetical protein